MNTQEFSNQFDTLISAYYKGLSDALTFDEYEKSVFLTEAQEEIVVELYSGKNSFGDSFEKTEEVRRFLSSLNKNYTTSIKIEGTGLSNKSVFFNIPNDVWFITYEAVTLTDNNIECLDKEEAIVVPTTQDDFYKVRRNPFKGPNKRRVLRLDSNNNTVELVSDYNIDKYSIRYLSKPNPIILTHLSDLSINGVSEITECELNPVIHRIILERAVRKAIASRIPAGNQ